MDDGTTKYNDTDYKKVLDPEDDAATATLGAPWRMPTINEMMELIQKCTWTQVEQDGKKCYEVRGPNSNSIFLPCAGYRKGIYFYDLPSWSGAYWTSSVDVMVSECANLLYFEDTGPNDPEWMRERGLSIRPVHP